MIAAITPEAMPVLSVATLDVVACAISVQPAGSVKLVAAAALCEIHATSRSPCRTPAGSVTTILFVVATTLVETPINCQIDTDYSVVGKVSLVQSLFTNCS